MLHTLLSGATDVHQTTTSSISNGLPLRSFITGCVLMGRLQLCVNLVVLIPNES